MTEALGAGEYAEGAAWLVAIAGACALASWIVVRRRCAHLPPAAALLAGGVLLYGLVVAVHLVPGALGLLTRPAVLLCAAAALGLAVALSPVPAEREPARHPAVDSRLSLAIAAIASVAFAAWLVAAASGRIPNPITTTDVAGFDLPLIARWIQDGSLWGMHEFVPLTSHGAYPHHGVIATLAVVLPWDSDFAARLVAVVVIPFAALAVGCLARELGAPRASAITLSIAAVSVPIVGVSGVDLSMPDALLYATLTAGVLFLVRHARTGLRSDLVVAGVSLGLAFGTKWYGVSACAVVLAVWAVGWIVARRDFRALAGNAAILIALVGVCGGFWLIRNWVAYDNPLYPLDVSPLGLSLFDAPPDPFRERAGASLADRLSSPADLVSELGPRLRDAFGTAGILLVAGVLAVLAAIAVRIRSRLALTPTRLSAVGIAAVGILFAYLVTPYTAGPDNSTTLAFINARYAVPGLMLAAACCAAAMAWLPRARPAVELLALVAIADGLANSATAPRGRFLAAILALLALAALAWRFRDRLAALRRPGLAPRMAAATVALVVAGALAAGYRSQEILADSRLKQDGVLAYVLTEAEPGARIGLAGVWDVDGPPPTLSAFGARLQNEVEYVGPVVDSQLRYPRSIGDFRRRLQAGGFSMVIVGRAPLPANKAAAWAEELNLSELAQNRRFRLYDSP